MTLPVEQKPEIQYPIMNFREYLGTRADRNSIDKNSVVDDYAAYYHKATNKANGTWNDEDMLASFSRKIGIQTLHEASGKSWLKDYKQYKNKK